MPLVATLVPSQSLQQNRSDLRGCARLRERDATPTDQQTEKRASLPDPLSMVCTHLEHLGAVMRHTLQAGTDEMRAALTALAIEAHDRYLTGTANDYEYFRELVHELSRVRGSALAETRIGSLFDAAQYFYLAADNLGSIAASKHALDLAQTERLRDLEWRAHYLLGLAYGDSANLSSAMEHFGEAVVIAEDLRDDDAIGSIADRVGVVLNAACQPALARECLSFALQKRATRGGFAHWHLSALTHYADTLYQLEHYAGALASIREALTAAPVPTNANEQMAALERESVYIRILLAVDDVAGARNRTENYARPLALRCNSPRAPFKIVLLESLCDVHEKNFDLGITRLARELENVRLKQTRAVSQTELLAEIARAYELAGDHKKARNTLRELTEISRRSWQAIALEQHRAHMKRLGVDARNVGEATGSFKRREQILDSEVRKQESFRLSIELLERFAITAELREDPEGVHIYRVGKLTALIAAEWGHSEDECATLELAARLHDIGKADPSFDVVLQAAELTPDQRRLMQEHTRIGQQLLASTPVPGMSIAEGIALYHHERWDGSGYPGNLSGSAIPLAARFVAIADVFDALTHPRRWRGAMSVPDAIKYIRENSGTHFDPQLALLAAALIERLHRECPDLDAYLGSASQESGWAGGLERVRVAMAGSIPPIPNLPPPLASQLPGLAHDRLAKVGLRAPDS